MLNYFLTFSLNILNPYFNELLLTLKLNASPLAGANIEPFFNMTMAFFAFFLKYLLIRYYIISYTRKFFILYFSPTFVYYIYYYFNASNMEVHITITVLNYQL
ncbi:hypothetical protein D6200_07955 [Tenacibaculum mesophilum]|uniref:Uncharacterized protein n=1 Tax=Tenacibaculum mesophilum TaxID=104268 RepID=A0ABM7CFE8_9FLAO|nr:hypothetical protein D6200_07955 [Tenacibaculum mesophilum]